MFRLQQQKLRSLIGALIAPLIDLDVFTAPHVWQRRTGCDSSTHASWLRQTDRRTSQLIVPQSVGPPSSTQHIHCVIHLTPLYPRQPKSTRYSEQQTHRSSASVRTLRCAALASCGWSGGTAAEADTMRVTDSHMVSAATLFPLRLFSGACEFVIEAADA